MRRTHHTPPVLYFMAGILLAGCGSDKDSKQGSSVVALRRQAASWKPPTEKECLAFGAEIEEVVARGDANALNALINWNALVDRAIGGLNMSAESRRGFSSGFRQSLGGPDGLALQVVQAIAHGGSYRLLRVRRKGDGWEVLFRLNSEDGLNYHAFQVVKQSSERVRAIDLYIFSTGEDFSKSIRRLILPVVAQQSKSWLEKLTTDETDMVKHMKDFQQLGDCIRTEQYQRALDIAARLPESLRQQKVILLMRYQAAQNVSERELQNVIAEFQRLYPNDASLDLILIDGYLLKKEYDKALASVDRLDKSVGGDSFLNVIRANILGEQGMLTEAIAAANAAIEGNPDMQECYLTLVGLHLLSKDHARTVEALNLLEQRFEMQYNDLRQVPEYADFVQSPEGQQWMREHGL